nr:translation initiation factor IF-2-like [Anser cygnoides]
MKCCSRCAGSSVPEPDARPPAACASPSCCCDAQGGCAGSPLPCPGPTKRPGSPSASTRSAESLGGSGGSADASSPAGSASLKPGTEEALGTMLAASCKLSPGPSGPGPAIDRSFITTSLAAQMLEEFLSQQVPAAAAEVPPVREDVPEENNRPGPVAPTASLERLRRHNRRFQRAKRCRGSAGGQRDAPGARPTCGPAGGPTHGWATRTAAACATLSPESRICHGAAATVIRAGRIPHCEPPTDNQGPPRTPSCGHAEPGTSPLRGCGCGCPPRWSWGRSTEEPRREPDGERSRHRHREPAGTLAQGRDLGGEPEGPAAWAPPQQRPGAMNTVQLIAKTFELRAQRDAAQAERDRRPPFCRRGAMFETSPQEPRGPCSLGCCGGHPRARGSLPPECSRARGAAQPCCGCKARGGLEGAGCAQGERSGRSQR